MTTADDAPQFPEMRRRGFFDDLPTDIFPEPEAADHKADAVQWVEAAARSDLPADLTVAVAAVAQVHATLYLAEQQRIGNLIAFEVISGEKNRAEIRKGLGL
jgi:hypothetical protein